MNYKERLKKYRREIEQIEKDLKFGQHYKVIESKLLDLYGQLDPDASNTEIRNKVMRIFDPKFSEFLNDVDSKYDEIVKIVNDLYKDLGVDIQRDMKKVKAIEQANLLDIGRYSNAAKRKLVKATREGLIKKLPHKELAKLYKKKMGKELKEEGFEFHAETWARTQAKGYGQSLKMQKANIAEVFWYDYVGIFRPAVTRAKCKECLMKKHLHINFINEQDGETWPGQKKPFSIYCGGWNCVHHLEPNPFYKGN